MQGDFDDILGQDDPEKEHKKWVEENKTEKPSNKSFRVLNDAYQKAQKRWSVDEELKEEFDYRYEKAKAKLELEKEEFEFEFEGKIDFTEKEIEASSEKAKEIYEETKEYHKRWKKGMGIK